MAGGAGFIGSHLCDALLALGYHVTALDNFITGSSKNVAHHSSNPNFRLIEHDVTQPLPDIECDAVFNLASPASPEGYGRYPLETMYTNAFGTLHTLELAHRYGSRYLLTSTSEVYGDPLVHPQPETYWGNVNPVGPRSCYDEGKRFAEALVFNFGQQKGLDYRIVRIFNTYGPRNHPEDGRVIPNFLTQALAGKPITVYGDGSQTRSFCFVSDLVEGLIRMMFTDAASHQVVNLGNPTEFTVSDLALQVQSITGTRSPIEHLPARPEEIAQRKPDIQKALSLLNWAPNINLETGLMETVAWLKATLQAPSPAPAPNSAR